MNDLLGADRGFSTKFAPPNRRQEDVEDPQAQQAPSDANMKVFFDEVGEIKNLMALVKKQLQKLQEDNEQSKLITRAPEMKALKQKMQDAISEVTKIARKIKANIEALDKANAASRQLANCGEGSSTDRTRTSITNGLKKKLKEIMDEFQELRNRLADEYRETVERRYFTVTGEQPDEEVVDNMIESGDAEAIFRKAIQDQGRGKVLDTLKEIEERHDAVKEIEKQLLELHQIFMDMATLVEAQGELVDNIETNVGQAVEHVKAGNVMLVKARDLQKNTRKWIICGVCTLIIIIVVVVLIVVKPWSIKK